ncbi:MAG: putative acyl-CoA dehydrogenase, partial [Thermoleophilaceae bacterium]|nr:putative acyl-CoA dehydrogenase [Thermoleophilaceae bacterium]
MPRLYREAPLNSIWEGSGNVNCLDVLRGMVRSPESVEAFFGEVESAGGEVADYSRRVRDELTDLEDIEFRARRIVESMAIALQASVLVRHGDPAVADAFVATRLAGDRGRALGTLPRGVDCERIVERHRPLV